MRNNKKAVAGRIDDTDGPDLACGRSLETTDLEQLKVKTFTYVQVMFEK